MNALSMSSIHMWHGAMRWQPPIELRAPKGGQAEHGAGLYLCCHRATAQKYAKGGGNLVHIELNPATRWLEEITVQPEVLLDAAREIPRLRNRLAIMTDIERAGRRRDGLLGLNVLVNLAVNHNAMTGQPALEITRFLVAQGADASLYARAGGDDWVVVFNPKVVQASRVIRAAEVDSLPFDFACVAQQITEIRLQPHIAAHPAPQQPPGRHFRPAMLR